MKKSVLFAICLCLCGIYMNLSASYAPPEYYEKRNAVEAHVARICSEFGDDAFPELYKVFKENIDDVMYVSRIVKMFGVSALDPTAEGDAEVLKMMREAVDAYNNNNNLSSAGWAITYLTLKGDESDLARFSAKVNITESTIFKARVAGTNLFGEINMRNESGGMNMDVLTWVSKLRPPFVPSVANTGPQAFYVYEVLKQAWENAGEDASKIPAELLTIVVWFDEDGNPVCNVDLAKYGLTMPELDVPNRPKGKPKVAAAPPPSPEKPVTATRDETPPVTISEDEPSEAKNTPSRLWFYVGALAFLSAVGTAFWHIRRKR